MDFFEHQERARRNTGRLVLLFVLAVAGIVAAVYLAVVALVVTQTEGATGLGLWNLDLFLVVAAGVTGVVTLGSLYKTAQLRGGGEVVAKRLGGRRLDPGTRNWKERRVLNVVEEMAIASGTPVPAVFLLEDEEGINAFAAGFGEGDAVVGVTRGCMEKLSRDELQGVVAHEFSHILNGDMRLNLRLMGVLHGILLIGLVGRILIHSGGGRRRRSSRDSGGGIALFGLALMLIGYIGTFFGNLIKAGVSRQREFLADASAVQFTRDPGGIGGALRKIGGFAGGSKIHDPSAAEASHMFFGDGVSERLSSALSTHPPLNERIARIDPSFEGEFPAVPPDYVAPPEPEYRALVASLAGPGAAPVPGGGEGARAPRGVGRPAGVRSGGGAPPAEPGEGGPDGGAFAAIGRPGPEHVAHARRLLAGVPEPLMEAAHETPGARAVVYALLLSAGEGDASDGGSRAPEVEVEAAVADALSREEPGVAALARELAGAAGALPRESRLPLMEVVTATLQGMSGDGQDRFRDTARGIIQADGVLDLEEWILMRLLLKHLDERRDPGAKRSPRYRSLEPFTAECAFLFGALAHAGHDDPAEARRALGAAASAAGLGELELRSREECAPRALEGALERLDGLVPPMKRRLLRGCAASVAADGRVTAREAELFRVVADWLGAPVPPLLPGQRLA